MALSSGPLVIVFCITNMIIQPEDNSEDYFYIYIPN